MTCYKKDQKSTLLQLRGWGRLQGHGQEIAWVTAALGDGEHSFPGDSWAQQREDVGGYTEAHCAETWRPGEVGGPSHTERRVTQKSATRHRETSFSHDRINPGC